MKKLLAGLAAAAILVYAGIIGFMVVQERDLVYHPFRRAVDAPPEHFALNVRTVSFASGDGTRLSAWVIPAARADSSGMWLLICHGNFGNIGYGQRPEFYAHMRDLGVNLLAFDYRGFGDSEGTPSEQGVYDDAEAAYRYLRDSLHVPAEQVVLFGHSLGSGVATELATHVPAAALIVEGAYTAVTDRGGELYPWLPVRYIMRNRFASIDKIGRVTVPKLFLHSPEDDVIPLAHGRRLFASAPEPKRFVEVRGGHADAYRVDRDVYFGAIAHLVDSVNPAAHSVAAASPRGAAARAAPAARTTH
jgi:fermentation-respiration switch protein FrsA (DUF1100 family)